MQPKTISRPNNYCFYCRNSTINSNQICNICNLIIRESGQDPEAFKKEFFNIGYGEAITSEIDNTHNQIIKIKPLKRVFYYIIKKELLSELIRHKKEYNLYFIADTNFMVHIFVNKLFNLTNKDQIACQCKLVINTSHRARIYYILKIRAYNGQNIKNIPILESFSKFFNSELEKRLYINY